METPKKKNKFQLKIFTDRKSMVIFIACLILSVIFWLLLSLSEDYDEHVMMKVKYQNLPEDKVLLHQLPEEVDVFIKAEGFKLLGIKSGFFDDYILIDFKNIKLAKTGSYYTFNWVNREHLTEISSKDQNNFSVLSVFPDTIKIVMDNKLSKVMPVRFSDKNTFAQNFKIIGNIQIVPDSVHVTGAKNLLNNMHYLYTDSLYFPAQEGVVEKKVKLMIPVGTTVKEGEYVTVKFLMQSMKLRSFEVPIVTVNVPAVEDLKLLPGSVTVNFMATDSTYNKLSKKDFLVTANYKDLIFSLDKIEVHLDKFPQGIELPGLVPAKVEYILRK